MPLNYVTIACQSSLALGSGWFSWLRDDVIGLLRVHDKKGATVKLRHSLCSCLGTLRRSI